MDIRPLSSVHLRSKKDRAFTLIEILVVVSIIGLLASIVLASLHSARDKAQNAQVLSEMHQIFNATQLYYANNGYYPGGSTCFVTGVVDSTSACCVGTSCTYAGGAQSQNVNTELGPYIKNLPQALSLTVGSTYQGYFFMCTELDSSDHCVDGYILSALKNTNGIGCPGSVIRTDSNGNTLCALSIISRNSSYAGEGY